MLQPGSRNSGSKKQGAFGAPFDVWLRFSVGARLFLVLCVALRCLQFLCMLKTLIQKRSLWNGGRKRLVWKPNLGLSGFRRPFWKEAEAGFFWPPKKGQVGIRKAQCYRWSFLGTAPAVREDATPPFPTSPQFVFFAQYGN